MSRIKEMTFLEHLLELRYRLIYIVIAFTILFIFGFYFSDKILVIMLNPIDNIVSENNNSKVIVTHFTTIMLKKISICFYFGFFLTLPVILYQLVAFFLPAIDKKIHLFKVICFIILATLFFVLGFLFSYFVIVPNSIYFFQEISNNFLASYNNKILNPQSQNMIESFYILDNYLDYFLNMSIMCGFVFELPIVINMLVYLNILDVKRLNKIRPFLYVIFFILAAFMTPPDFVSQILLAMPMILLFELSVVSVLIIYSKKQI